MCIGGQRIACCGATLVAWQAVHQLEAGATSAGMQRAQVACILDSL